MKDESFEKYWQEQFEHFETEPDEMVWNKMSQELFVRQSKSMFKNFIVQPGAHVWRKIAIVLWWNRFTKFSPYTFNAYYLLVAILSTITLGAVFELNHHRYDKKTSSDSVVNNFSTNPRTASVWLENTTNPFDESKNSNSNQSNPQVKLKNNIPTMHHLQVLAEENMQPFRFSDEVHSLQSISPTKISQSKSSETFNLSVDTIYKWSHHRSLSFYFAPIYFNPSLSFNELNGEVLKSNYNPIASNAFNNYAFSLFYEWQHFNFTFQTGLSYQSLSKSYTYNHASFFNDTIYHQQIIDNSHYDYSYIQVLNLDSLLLTGDTVWITYVDSTLVLNFDTLQTSEIETVRKNTHAKQKYTISAIEIPFLVGYSYSFGKFDLTLKAGSSISYILLTRGYLPSAYNDYGTEPFNHEKVHNFYLNIMAAAEANYFITDKISLSFMPLYRHNITRLIKNELPIKLNYNSWSFNVGIKYQLR